MKDIEYSYCVIRYVHDPVAGESLNLGVVLCAPAVSFCTVSIEYRYERLAQAFVNFDGEHFKRTMWQLESAINEVSTSSLVQPIQDVEALRLRVWPDNDLSYQFGPMLVGLTDDPADEVERLFDRMVLSQQPRQLAERHAGELVWAD
ncbi:MAG: DUF3037 domain-containing protein [Acidobacteria bacterium]|nr:DUF3037 domain-containing protein [Acidobacteriota bacterium]